MLCSKCTHESYCDMAQFGGHEPPITACSKFKKKQQTNADRIRSITSDEELAQEIWSCHVFSSFTDLLDWLKKRGEKRWLN